ncbi:Tim44/TimA family putative adaptor protein [Maricaulis sp. D1M11]|uniref:Tim44/TimA family putative adaptor protein n=1 Tax=Maricaulis sp. D1M11 TaxID=3076117 RepID=UPI0039B381C6
MDLFSILIFAAVAVFFAVKLYSVLGRHEGHMEPPTEAPSPTLDTSPKPVDPDPVLAQWDASAISGLEDIARHDMRFDPQGFVQGAKSAYATIVEAFAKGDRQTLKTLLSEKVYTAYVTAIEAREARGEDLLTVIEHIDKAHITAAEKSGNTARVTVEFAAQIGTETRNDQGEAISGDLDRLSKVHEAWVFERDLTSTDPNWVLTRVTSLA